MFCASCVFFLTVFFPGIKLAIEKRRREQTSQTHSRSHHDLFDMASPAFFRKEKIGIEFGIGLGRRC